MTERVFDNREKRHPKNPSRYMLPQKTSPDRQRARAGTLEFKQEDYVYAVDQSPGHPETGFYLPPHVLKLPTEEKIPLEVKAGRFATGFRLALNRLLARGALPNLKSMKGYENLYYLVDPPSVTERWQDDAEFGRQRLAGANPLSITRCSEPPPGPIWNAAARVLEYSARTTLHEALDGGRLFMTHYPWLADDRIQTAVAQGNFLVAPLCLFFASDSGDLQPLAIQSVSDTGAVVTPLDDRNAWLLGRAHAQCADLHYHVAANHLLGTHFVSAVFRIAAARQLHPDHPLSQLMAPHFAGTLAAADVLRNPDSKDNRRFIDRALAAGTDGIFDLARILWKDWSFEADSLHNDLSRRGIYDREILSTYWYRDDAIAVWGATRDYVERALGAWYLSDADVAEDYELQRWLDELKTPDGGGINGLPSSVTTKESLYPLVTEIIFRASGGHAAARNAQYDNLASLLNAPGKLLTGFPDGTEEIDYPQALPGLTDSLAQVTLFGEYASLTRTSLLRPQEQPAMAENVSFEAYQSVGAFRRHLAGCQNEIELRNRSLEAPYTSLVPTNIPCSPTL